MSNKKIVACIAAHPDDEILGCGGTLARHADEGDEVHIILLADGVGAGGSNGSLDERRTAARKAAQIVGAKDIHFFSYPDNKMDTIPLLEITQTLETLCVEIRPEVIYTHHQGDLNIDHRITHQAVLTACRPQPGTHVRAIYAFEVVSATGWAAPTPENAFNPSLFVDIEEQLGKKLEALKAYEVEMRPYPHARSCKALESMAYYRGSTAGLVAAEAFSVIRLIEK